jgi:hypothetical protein
MRRAFLAAALGLALGVSILADEGEPLDLDALLGQDGEEGGLDQEGSELDALLEGPEEEPKAGGGIDLRTSLEKEEKVLFKGSFSATGGASIGWASLENLAPEGFASLIGLEASTTLSFDARPDVGFRVYGSLSTSVGLSALSWPTPSIKELFVDYTLLDAVFFRIGQHTMKWGQGRLFTPGNLMAGSEKGLAFRASLPALLNGFSFVALAHEDFFESAADPRLSEFGLGGIADIVIGPVQVSLGAYHQALDGWRMLSSLKTVLFGFDLFSDIVASYEEPRWELSALAGFYWESKDRSFKAYGEYFHDGSEEAASHADRLGLALGFSGVFGSPFDFGLRWDHCFNDLSGYVLPGISLKPAPHLACDLGILLSYSRQGSYYHENNPDPGKRALALALKISLSGGF